MHIHKNCRPNLHCKFHCCYKALTSGDISLTVFFDDSRRHNDVILLPAIYAECLVTTLCSSRTEDSAPHIAPRTCNGWTAASRNAKLSCAQPVASKRPRSQSCVLRDLGCHAASCVYHRQIHSVDELKRRLIDVWCGLEQSIFDEAIDQWRGRHK